MNTLKKVGLIGGTLLSLLSPIDLEAQSCRITKGSITLAWNPSPSPEVVSYTVYNGLASRSYFTANSTTNLVTTITIPIVLGRPTYYAATAVDNYRLESDFSEELVYTPPNPELFKSNISSVGGSNLFTITYFPNPKNSAYGFSFSTHPNAGYSNIPLNQWTKLHCLESRSLVNGKVRSTLKFLFDPSNPNITFKAKKFVNPSSMRITRGTGSTMIVSFRAADYDTLKNYNVYAQQLGGTRVRYSVPTNNINGIITKTLTGLKPNTTYSFSVSASVITIPGAFETAKTKPITAITGKRTYTPLVAQYIPITPQVSASSSDHNKAEDKESPLVKLLNTVSKSDYVPELEIYPKGSELNPLICVNSNIVLHGTMYDYSGVSSMSVSGDISSTNAENVYIDSGNWDFNIDVNNITNVVNLLATDNNGNNSKNPVHIINLTDVNDIDLDDDSDLREFAHFKNPFNPYDKHDVRVTIKEEGDTSVNFVAENIMKKDMPYYLLSSQDLIKWEMLPYSPTYYTNNLDLNNIRMGEFIVPGYEEKQFFNVIDEIDKYIFENKK